MKQTKTKRLERDFQSNLIKELYELFPECIVLKTDPNYIQGLPDLLILYKKTYAVLDCKRYKDAPKQPNQQYYIDSIGQYVYSGFIYPENKEEVLHELQQTFGT